MEDGEACGDGLVELAGGGVGGGVGKGRGDGVFGGREGGSLGVEEGSELAWMALVGRVEGEVGEGEEESPDWTPGYF